MALHLPLPMDGNHLPSPHLPAVFRRSLSSSRPTAQASSIPPAEEAGAITILEPQPVIRSIEAGQLMSITPEGDPSNIIKQFLQNSAANDATDLDIIPYIKPYYTTSRTIADDSNIDPLSQSQVCQLIVELARWEDGAGTQDSLQQSLKRIETSLIEKKRSEFGSSPSYDKNVMARRLRIQLYFCDQGLAIGIRFLKTLPPDYKKLGIPDPVSNSIISYLSKKRGFALITGPTGSGKSTTLAAFIDYIRRTCARKVVTIEQPIEILYRNPTQNFLGRVVQQEVGRDVLSFEDGLEGALRKNPHIVLYGEIRDAATMETCLRSIETGLLIVATLHTSGVQSTLRRITEFFPPEKSDRILKACSESLLFVLSQGLAPRRDGKGSSLIIEYLTNDSTESKGAISNALDPSNPLKDVLSKPCNISWETSIDRLCNVDQVISPETAKIFKNMP